MRARRSGARRERTHFEIVTSALGESFIPCVCDRRRDHVRLTSFHLPAERVDATEPGEPWTRTRAS
ncbi:hypothetical protein ABIQ69_02485 [Agromyces sp. G08B096]|uniref:Uncharacterized protein n=1 Tax=Agromyces sp. G08B096 TaxID=3156399 RepID=A0AAU7W8L4_9MICO